MALAGPSSPPHVAAPHPPADSPVRAAPTTRVLVKVPLWLLALFTFSGTLAMHIFVPALPYAAEDLAVGKGTMQLTVSLYIAGLALGQLAYGPLADRFGRRPTLMAGLGLYTVAGFAAAVAPTAGFLIVARLFQALGGCAGLVIGRAVVRDTALPEEAARRLALMNLMVTLGPGVAPIAGAFIADGMGWRTIFYGLCLLGIVNFVFTWRMLPETGRLDLAANTDARTLARNYLGLFRSPAFVGYAVGGGCATTAMYAFIASAPFIYVHQLHRTPHEVGVYLAIMIGGIWLGSVLATRLIRRVALQKMMVRGNVVSLVVALALLLAAASGHLSAGFVVPAMFVYTIGSGVASPAALTEAISVDPRVIGSASGLYGFTQMAVGAACSALAGLGEDPALVAATVMLGACLVGQAGFFVASRSRRAG